VPCLRPLLSVILLPFCAACSHLPFLTPMPQPPANLSSPCPLLPEPPDPLIDPDRAQWEGAMIARYGECGAKQQALAGAWQEAAKSKKR